MLNKNAITRELNELRKYDRELEYVFLNKKKILRSKWLTSCIFYLYCLFIMSLLRHKTTRT